MKLWEVYLYVTFFAASDGWLAGLDLGGVTGFVMAAFVVGATAAGLGAVLLEKRCIAQFVLGLGWVGTDSFESVRATGALATFSGEAVAVEDDTC